MSQGRIFAAEVLHHYEMKVPRYALRLYVPPNGNQNILQSNQHLNIRCTKKKKKVARHNLARADATFAQTIMM